MNCILEERTSMSVLQGSYMSCYALHKRRDRAKFDVVATFKDTHKSSLAKLVGDLLKIFCQPLIVKFINTSVV